MHANAWIILGLIAFLIIATYLVTGPKDWDR